MMSERSWKKRCGAWASAWCWRCRSASASPISSPTNSSGARAPTPRSISPSSRRSACASPRDRALSRKRFIEPLAARIFGNYPELDYLQAVRTGAMPPNVRVIEFFFEPGSLLNSRARAVALSVGELHARGARAAGARRQRDRARGRQAHWWAASPRSASAATPMSPSICMPELAKLRAAGQPVVMLGQVHREMPFMLGAANVGADAFDLLLDHSRYDYDLFAPPNPSLSTVDHAIGLHASSLVRDGGTLQIGIGELGDSIVYSLLLRHQQNEAWRRALRRRGHGTQRGAHRRRRRARAVRHGPVRRDGDVRRPDARPVSRRHPAAARVRLSTLAARAGRERFEHARR